MVGHFEVDCLIFHIFNFLTSTCAMVTTIDMTMKTTIYERKHKRVSSLANKVEFFGYNAATGIVELAMLTYIEKFGYRVVFAESCIHKPSNKVVQNLAILFVDFQDFFIA